MKANDYRLKFTYPTVEEKKQLRLINKEISGKKKSKHKRIEMQAQELLNAVKSGEIDADLLIDDLRKLKESRGKK